MTKEVRRYIDCVEISKGDAVVMLNDGSYLSGVFSVAAATTSGDRTYVTISAYITNEDTLLDELLYPNKK